MQIDNATDENIEVFQDIANKLSETNPDLETRVYPMEAQPSNAKIFEKLETIERQLKLIFDGHVLINGEFNKL